MESTADLLLNRSSVALATHWATAYAEFCFLLLTDKTGNKVGFKPAGGINTVNDALIYYTIVKEILGEEWLNNELFRLGTSRLANLLLSEIKGEETKFF